VEEVSLGFFFRKKESFAKPQWSNTLHNLCAQYVVNLYWEQSLKILHGNRSTVSVQ